MNRRRTCVLLVVVALGTAVFLTWFRSYLRTGDEIPFLAHETPAAWITYPAAPRTGAHTTPYLSTDFKRRFAVTGKPDRTLLRVRFFRHGEVAINGRPIALPAAAPSGWKQVVEQDVTQTLLEGDNEIVVRVVNEKGPPALWLSLAADHTVLATDSAWQASLMGAVWRPARDADLPMSRWALGSSGGVEEVGNPSPWTGMRHRWPTLVLLAVLSTLSLIALRRFERRPGGGGMDAGERLRGWCGAVLIATVVVLWAALFWNNAPVLYPFYGFDALKHVEYIDYILANGSLPLADQGWEMYQPPLYYLLAAGLLAAFGYHAVDATNVFLPRLILTAAACMHVVLVFLSLRIVFPGRVRRQMFGVILATFLPAQLYTFQYITNEPLGAVGVSLCVYLCLRILHAPRVTWVACLVLGVCLGAALLAKFSAAIAVPLLLAALGLRLWRERAGVAGLGGRLAVVGLSAIAVCGWHFGRVWAHFGKPFVGNWDVVSGFHWWQDPGYHTSSYYLGFGEWFKRPVFSAFHSFGDAIYSTLWGDGLNGGFTSTDFRPPWDGDLMAAGYLLAILPTAGILIGVGLAVVRFARRRTPVWGLLVGLGMAVPLAIIAMSLKLPYYAQARAIYGLGVLIPLCVFGAWGVDRLAGCHKIAGLVLCVWMGVWGLSSYLTYWADRSSIAVQVAGARVLAVLGNDDRAEESLRIAALRSPTPPEVMRVLAGLEMRQGRSAEALARVTALLESGAAKAEDHLLMARLEWRRGRRAEAVTHCRQAIALDPDQSGARASLAAYLSRSGQPREAIAAYRELLAFAPDDVRIHRALSALYRRTGDPAAAQRHTKLATDLRQGSRQ